MKKGCISFCIGVLMLVGYVRCVSRIFQCDWDSQKTNYKSEAFYTIGTFTGLGCFFGWFNVGEDTKYFKANQVESIKETTY